MFNKTKKSGEIFFLEYSKFKKKFKAEPVLGKDYNFGDYKATLVYYKDTLKFIVK